MPISPNALPTVPPEYAAPVDGSLTFANAQTLAATGYVNNANQQLAINPGRSESMLMLNINSLDVSSGNEFYQLMLMGSNDVNWANGNVELLAAVDFAAASAQRLVPTILGASPAIPSVGRNGARRAIFFSNKRER